MNKLNKALSRLHQDLQNKSQYVGPSMTVVVQYWKDQQIPEELRTHPSPAPDLRYLPVEIVELIHRHPDELWVHMHVSPEHVTVDVYCSTRHAHNEAAHALYEGIGTCGAVHMEHNRALMAKGPGLSVYVHRRDTMIPEADAATIAHHPEPHHTVVWNDQGTWRVETSKNYSVQPMGETKPENNPLLGTGFEGQTPR